MKATNLTKYLTMSAVAVLIAASSSICLAATNPDLQVTARDLLKANNNFNSAKVAMTTGLRDLNKAAADMKKAKSLAEKTAAAKENAVAKIVFNKAGTAYKQALLDLSAAVKNAEAAKAQNKAMSHETNKARR